MSKLQHIYFQCVDLETGC